MPGRLAARMRELGIRSGVGAPVIVDDSAWGALIVTTTSPQPLPAGTELRLASFADLIGTAVSNATARSELIASRERMVTTFDAARQRVTRDLHDGAQQQLVSTIINLQLALKRTPEDQVVHGRVEQRRQHLPELAEPGLGVHRHVARRGVGEDEVPPLPHLDQVRDQPRPGRTRPQAVLRGHLGQRLPGRRRVLVHGRKLVPQVARSNQPPVVSHGCGVYENECGQRGNPGSTAEHSSGI
jgi:hypothetical protein